MSHEGHLFLIILFTSLANVLLAQLVMVLVVEANLATIADRRLVGVEIGCQVALRDVDTRVLAANG